MVNTFIQNVDPKRFKMSQSLNEAGTYDGYCPICGSSNCNGECAPHESEPIKYIEKE